MHTVELLEAALRLAATLGYDVRHEWLGGSGGGRCVLKGRQCLFVDLALTPDEQLERVVAALREDPQAATRADDAALASLLAERKAA